jgi:hypothetical protein
VTQQLLAGRGDLLVPRHQGRPQPGDMTREQLAQQAGNADISGTSGLSKDQLQEKVHSEAEN